MPWPKGKGSAQCSPKYAPEWACLNGHSQARSQDLEKGGGLFWKSEKSANILDPNLHCSWISFTRFVRNLRGNFSESSEIRRFFPPKIRWSPKKTKKKVFTEIETDFSAKIGISNVSGGLCSYGGGYFQFLTKNRLQKHQKRAILHTSQANGGARAPPAPPPGYTTGHSILVSAWNHSTSVFKRCGLLILLFVKKFIYNKICSICTFPLVLRCLIVARKDSLAGVSTGLTEKIRTKKPKILSVFSQSPKHDSLLCSV